MSVLRSGSNKWGPKWVARKAAWRKRGVYECAGYERKPHLIPASIKKGKKRINNVTLDHKVPVIGPEGFISWDRVVERLFVEANGYQVLCLACHLKKSNDEKEARKKNGK